MPCQALSKTLNHQVRRRESRKQLSIPLEVKRTNAPTTHVENVALMDGGKSLEVSALARVKTR